MIVYTTILENEKNKWKSIIPYNMPSAKTIRKVIPNRKIDAMICQLILAKKTDQGPKTQVINWLVATQRFF